MEEIKNWAFSVCCASIAGGILNLLLPEGNVQKIYKTVFCVFFLCIIFSPLSEIKTVKIDFSENENFPEENFHENEFMQNSAEYIQNELVKSVNEILSEENLSAEDISVNVNISEEGSIDINKFALTFENFEDADSFSEKIYQKTGIKPEIIISGE